MASIHATQPGTWDATYQGLPLDQRAYDASLDILRKLVAGPVGSLGLCTASDERHHHEALVALAQCGITHDLLTSGSLYGGRVELTVYGRRYAAERDIVAAS